jgi:DNA ligase D-like protein (predicted 3'-phosphoesterase)
MSGTEKLNDYVKKRDLNKSGEPDGGKSSGKPVFVIQKHDASNLHYDFRLEVDSVLKSWAVPKGPSTDPGEKRLAIQTEDHPMDYADFEGVIPEEEYGGGTVMVWDRGSYKNIRAGKEDDGKSMEEALEDGLIEVWLEGEKLSGGYAMKRTGGKGEKSKWLLIKMKDDESDARRKPVSTEPDSVLTGRSIDEIAGEENDES